MPTSISILIQRYTLVTAILYVSEFSGVIICSYLDDICRRKASPEIICKEEIFNQNLINISPANGVCCQGCQQLQSGAEPTSGAM